MAILVERRRLLLVDGSAEGLTIAQMKTRVFWLTARLRNGCKAGPVAGFEVANWAFSFSTSSTLISIALLIFEGAVENYVRMGVD